MDSDRQQKQNYLYTQVVQSGFDANAFAQFLDSKKGNA